MTDDSAPGGVMTPDPGRPVMALRAADGASFQVVR
jgi:hypothetical protein